MLAVTQVSAALKNFFLQCRMCACYFCKRYMHVQHLTIVVIVVRQFKFILEAHLLFSNVEPSMQIANPFAVCYFVFTA